MRNLKITIFILVSLIIVYISCDKKVTEQPDTGTLIGRVLLQSRGLTYYIPNAKVNIDGHVTYSDSTGRFEIEVPKGVHTITCSKYPFDTLFVSKVTVLEHRAYNLIMDGPTYSIAGTVTDTMGNKIEGAVALLEHLRDTSDADGYIFFDSIPTGYWELQIIKDDFYFRTDSLEISFANNISVVQLIQRYFTVSGSVFDTLGNPKEDVLVELGNLDVLTNSAGMYELHPVENGEFEITAELSDYFKFVDSIQVSGFDMNFDIQLSKRLFTVSGIIYDTLGVPLSNINVTIDTLSTITNSQGEFTLYPFEEGSYEISCSANDYYMFFDSITVSGIDLNLSLSLIRKSYSVSGTVAHQEDGLLSDIEVVLDSLLFDTTDNNGNFSFEYIFSGDHQLEFFSDIYNYEKHGFMLGENDYNISMILKRFFIDTLWIEKDASVRIHDFYSYSYHSTTNYGNDTLLQLYSDYLEYFSNTDGYIYRNEVSRIFMELPDLDQIDFDSVLLVLSFGHYIYYNDPFDVRFSGILSPWEESSINWENQSIPDSIFLVLDQDFQNMNQFEANLTEYVSLMSSTNGLRISVNNEFYNDPYYGSGIWIYSSEHPDISKRPHILVYRSE